MNNKPIGLLDSGLGGFTIYYGLKAKYPKAPLVILADQKHSPYGPKTIDELEAITIKNIEFFQDLGIEHILFACNTTSGLLLENMQARFPHLHIKGVIDGTVNQVQASHKVAVVATKANIESHAYRNKILAHHPTMQVIEIMAHDLVDYIEGLADSSIIDKYVAKLLVDSEDADQIILGCTHYPLVKDAFIKARDVDYIESTQAMVSELEGWLVDNEGPSKIYTSGDAKKLKHQLKVIFKQDEVVEEVKWWNK